MLCFKIVSNLKSRKFSGNSENSFSINISTASQILTISKITTGVRAKDLEVTLLFVDISKASNLIHRGNMEQRLLTYGVPKETVTAIMMICKNTNGSPT